MKLNAERPDLTAMTAMTAMTCVLIAWSSLACLGDPQDPQDTQDPAPEHNNPSGPNHTDDHAELYAASTGYDAFVGLGGDTTAPGGLLPIAVTGAPLDGAQAPTDVQATSDQPQIVEVVRVTTRTLLPTTQTPAMQAPLIEVRGLKPGQATITITGRYRGRALQTTYRVQVIEPESSRLKPWCIERDAGSNLDARAALPGEVVWFHVEATSPGDTPQLPRFARGLRPDAILADPPGAVELVESPEYLTHYGLRVADDALRFKLTSSPRSATDAADYEVVSQAQITGIRMISYAQVLGLPLGQRGFAAWTTSTQDRFLCGQAERATVTTSTPERCEVTLVRGEPQVRDAMCLGQPIEGAINPCAYWLDWHPQQAIQIQAKAAGDCVFSLTLPEANAGQGLSASMTVPITTP